MKCKHKPSRTLCAIGIMGVFNIPMLAVAEQVLEEITVTATKRESSLQDTPMAVSAFTSDMMDDLDINNPFDFESLVPSLTYQQSPNRVFIRGVGRFDNSQGVNPGVAIYTDGIYFAEDSSMYQSPINVERTEVLRGPQGTLYGRNTTGGAINVITKKPSSEFDADIRAMFGDYGRQEIGFMVRGPFTDTFRYKLYVIDNERDGLQDNFAGPDVRTSNGTYAEGQLEYDITENLTAWVSYSENRYDYIPGDGHSDDHYDCVNNWSGLGRSVQFMECLDGKDNPTIGDPHSANRNSVGNIQVENNHNFMFRLTYNFEEASLMYLTGKIKYDWDQIATDYDGTARADYKVLLDVGQYQDQESHELQLTSNWDRNWDYLFGLFSFEDRSEQPYTIYNDGYTNIETVTLDFVNAWANPDEIWYFQNGIVDNESWAAFGELSFLLNDQWTVIVGARYSDDTYHGEETQIQYWDMISNGYAYWGGIPHAFDASEAHFAGDATRYTDTIDATYDDTFTNVSGRFTVDYRPIDNHLIWFTISNGYKMGGVRLGSLEKFYAETAGEVSDGKFNEEEVLMLELGWKGDLLDDRLRTEVVYFDYTYDEMQRLRSFKTPNDITLAEVVNVDVEMYGLEASATWLIGDNLRLISAYSYNHSEVVEDKFFRNSTYSRRDENGVLIENNVRGNTLVLTPRTKMALSGHYTLPTSFGEFMFGGTYAYVGKRYFDFQNFNSEDSYTRVDLQAHWLSATERYKVFAAINNATDEEMYNTNGCGSNGDWDTPTWVVSCSGNPMDQRLWTVQFSVSL